MMYSNHCVKDRYERIQFIINYIGIGEIIQERKELSNNSFHPYKYLCVTNTGITIVKSEDKSKVITVYVTTQKELIRVYNGRNNIPQKLWDKVTINEQRYTRNGKTIWP